jgi:hypothetical protein
LDFNAVKWGWTAASVRHGQSEFGRAPHGPEDFGGAAMRATKRQPGLQQADVKVRGLQGARRRQFCNRYQSIAGRQIVVPQRSQLTAVVQWLGGGFAIDGADRNGDISGSAEVPRALTLPAALGRLVSFS